MIKIITKDIESTIVNNLIASGLTRAEASKDAFLYINAIQAGEVDPETLEALGLEIED